MQKRIEIYSHKKKYRESGWERNSWIEGSSDDDKLNEGKEEEVTDFWT